MGLVLTRRVGETVVLGDQIIITIQGIHGHQARIHIEAPDELSVHRLEIYNRMREDQGLPPLNMRTRDQPLSPKISNPQPNRAAIQRKISRMERQAESLERTVLRLKKERT